VCQNLTYMATTVAGMNTDAHEIRPFRIAIPQSDVDDLRERLGRTRWTRPLPGDKRGVAVDRLRELADYWRTGYDWRRQEAELNEFPQYLTEIDGHDVHFLHVRSSNPGAVPVVLTHGWPNSIVEFARMIGPLSRECHVVVPSVPGFGFSQAPREPGWSTGRVAGMWAELMRRLGYDRYVVQGGDLGAYIAPETAVADPEHVAGVYVISGLGFPTQADVPDMNPDELAAYQMMQSQDWMTGVDHHALLRAAPLTFAYGWHDSPVAALAWHAHKFDEFGGLAAIDRDLFLTNLSLYWFTDTFGTSSWPMYDTKESRWPDGQTAAPTGVYSGPPGIRRLAERHNRIAHWGEGNAGSHHFVTMEEPAAVAADLIRFVATVG
jgi:pimeloyl-ACP methyl ester carboxylesterase